MESEMNIEFIDDWSKGSERVVDLAKELQGDN
jgi:hypothetical protein